MVDTTTRAMGLHENSQMSAIGWLMAGIMLIVLLPLLPFFIIFWAVDWLIGELEGDQDVESTL